MPRRKTHDFAAMLITSLAAAQNLVTVPESYERLAETCDDMALPKLKTIFSRETFHQTASLIFFHGEYGTAQEMKEVVKYVLRRDFSFPHIRVIYPQAPYIPYKMNDNKPSSVWYNRRSYNPTAGDDKDSIDYSCSLITQLVDEQKSRGVEPDRVVLGGVGIGGVIAMHAAFRFLPQIAGVFALSSVLGPESLVFKQIKQDREKDSNKVFPPLWLWHGSDDKKSSFKWAVQAAECLNDLSVDVEFNIQFGQEHKIVQTELLYLDRWVQKVLPEKQ